MINKHMDGADTVCYVMQITDLFLLNCQGCLKASTNSNVNISNKFIRHAYYDFCVTIKVIAKSHVLFWQFVDVYLVRIGIKFKTTAMLLANSHDLILTRQECDV